MDEINFYRGRHCHCPLNEVPTIQQFLPNNNSHPVLYVTIQQLNVCPPQRSQDVGNVIFFYVYLFQCREEVILLLIFVFSGRPCSSVTKANHNLAWSHLELHT